MSVAFNVFSIGRKGGQIQSKLEKRKEDDHLAILHEY